MLNQNKAYDVALAAYERYEDPIVEAALREAVDAIDGLSFVKPGILKPAPRSPMCFSMCWETACPARSPILSPGGS